jgi:ABC-2 type transport system permease protein
MKICTIIKKEYKQIVKKKSFIISTILSPILMAGFIFLPIFLQKAGREVKKIEVSDFSGLIQKQFIEESNKSKRVKEALKLNFTNIIKTDQKQNDLIKVYEKNILNKKDSNFQLIPEYKKKILDKIIDGLILIPENVKKTRQIYFCASNISDFETNKYISSKIQKILSASILKEKIDDPKIVEIVEKATQNIKPTLFIVKKEGTTKSRSEIPYIMSIFMLTLLFSIIMAYGQLIMRGIIEEKNNRIAEVLISSTKTQYLFYGKILGIGLAGLTQVALWIILGGLFISRYSFKIDKSVLSFFTPELIIYFVIFFILGYFMFSVLFSIVGASVNTDQEAQQYATPISFLLIIPFIIGIMITQNPNTSIVVLASFFPLFTPTLMFMRISIAIPSFFQIACSILSSLIFTMFLAWLGAKIFRTGILMYGKKPSLKEIIKWTRYR